MMKEISAEDPAFGSDPFPDPDPTPAFGSKAFDFEFEKFAPAPVVI